MDKRRFGPKKTGKIIEIATHGGLAFLPNQLPPAWQMPAEFWPEVVRVRQLMGELEGVGQILPNPAVLLKPLRNREAIDSSTIEGTYASPQELLLFEPGSASSGRSSESVREVSNYARAVETYSGPNDSRLIMSETFSAFC